MFFVLNNDEFFLIYSVTCSLSSFFLANLNTFFKTPRNQNSGGLTKMKDEFKLLAKKSKHEEEENEEDSDDDDKDDEEEDSDDW